MTNGIPSTENDETPAIECSDSDVPRLAEGVQLLGEYQGSAYQERRYLVYRADEQAVLLTPLLYQVLTHVDGRRSIADVAARIGTHNGHAVGADGVRYLIEKKLEPLGLVALHSTVEKLPVADPLLALSARGVLLPARVVRVIARIFAPLHLPPVVVAVLGTLLALDTWMFTSGHADSALKQTVAQPGYMLLTVVLTVAATVFHEWGHASGCHYGGARPGAIGVGLYVVFPCFYTNVTDAYRLNKAGRLRTDLGGIYFNAVFIVGMGCAYLWTGYAPLLASAVLGHGQIIQQLLPTLRMDGYYIVSDLIGVPNLFGLIGPTIRNMIPGRRGRHALRPETNLRPFARRVVTAWVLMVIPFLAGGLTLMVVKAPTYIAIAWQETNRHWAEATRSFVDGEVAGGVLAAVSTIMLWLPWVGLGILLVRMLGRATKAAGRAVARRRTRTAGPTPAVT